MAKNPQHKKAVVASKLKITDKRLQRLLENVTAAYMLFGNDQALISEDLVTEGQLTDRMYAAHIAQGKLVRAINTKLKGDVEHGE